MACIKHTIAVLLAFSLISIISGYNLQKLSSDISQMLNCSDYPGLAVSIVKDGKVIFAEGYGISNIQTKAKVTKTTLFGVASLSKAFAATLLVKLLEKTKYTVKSRVRDILGENFAFADEFRTKYATIEDLLTHRMGISSNNNLRFDTTLTRKNLLGRIKYLKGSRPFRSSYIYSNLMYGIITTMAEKLGRRTWEQLVKKELYQPLNMSSSSFATILDFENTDVALPYIVNNSTQEQVPLEMTRRWALLCGSGCVMSNAVDMANWMIFHLTDGMTPDGKQLMKSKSVKSFRTPKTVVTSLKYFNQPTFPRTTSKDTYGIGWFLGYYDGMRIQWHSGSTFGYNALMTLYPDYKLGIFTSLNGKDTNYKFRIGLHNYITDAILGKTAWLSPSGVCDLPSPWVNETSSGRSPGQQHQYILPSRSLDTYTGVYHNKAYGKLEIRLDNSSQSLHAVYGFAQLSLKRYKRKGGSKSKEYYFAQGVGITFQRYFDPFIFHLDSEDDPVTTISIPGFDKRDPPVFTRGKQVLSFANSLSVELFCSVLTMLVTLF